MVQEGLYLESPREDLDWSSLRFSYTKCPSLVISDIDISDGADGAQWSAPRAIPHDPLKLEPSAGALNYGQTIFEGIKAFRHDDGSIHMFRIDENAKRLQRSAERILIPQVPEEIFVRAVKMCCVWNSSYVPPYDSGGALYLRPLVVATEPYLGVRSSKVFRLVVYATPVGPFFSKPEGLAVRLVTGFHRSYPNGVGSTKMGGNYAPCMQSMAEARQSGYDLVLYLDAKGRGLVEESTAANFFALVDGVLRTPSTHRKTILDGITCDSICYIARHVLGMKVVDDEDLPVELVRTAEQAFFTGTAVIVSPVKRIGHEADSEMAVICKSLDLAQELKVILTDIQFGRREAPEGWLTQVTPSDLEPLT
ncbi:hypothetical protein NDN08_005184 [Rhodosorus marinus]|uniref:Branched-chain-amino-acid aminotransferase n=1 Tax=Rhodosorus marinus TaxID=101924 RepID=A0AAV8V0T6_9RHOD|nr:hypothetical protein NDN08_005184 [Rhodosorus marinus]